MSDDPGTEKAGTDRPVLLRRGDPASIPLALSFIDEEIDRIRAFLAEESRTRSAGELRAFEQRLLSLVGALNSTSGRLAALLDMAQQTSLFASTMEQIRAASAVGKRGPGPGHGDKQPPRAGTENA